MSSTTGSTRSTLSTTSAYLDENVLVNEFTAGLLLAGMGPASVREADFADDGLLVWIGTDATVSVPVEHTDRLVGLARNAGWHVRCGHTPADFGIEVEAFRPDYLHPVYGVSEAKVALASAWALVRETVGLTEQE